MLNFSILGISVLSILLSGLILKSMDQLTSAFPDHAFLVLGLGLATVAILHSISAVKYIRKRLIESPEMTEFQKLAMGLCLGIGGLMVIMPIYYLWFGMILLTIALTLVMLVPLDRLGKMELPSVRSFLAAPLFLTGLFSGILLIQIIRQPDGTSTVWEELPNLYFAISIVFPLTMVTTVCAKTEVFKAYQIPIPPLRKEVKSWIRGFTWNNPEDSKAHLNNLIAETDFRITAELQNFLSKYPLISSDYYPSRPELSKELFEKMKIHQDLRYQKMKDVLPLPEQAWCKRCKTRAQAYVAGFYNLAVGCRSCLQVEYLIPGVKAAIATRYLSTPFTLMEHGAWILAWDQQEGKFVPGDYDDVWVQGENQQELDWFVASMLQWAEDDIKLRRKMVRVILQNQPNLSENSLRMLKDADRNKLIQLISQNE